MLFCFFAAVNVAGKTFCILESLQKRVLHKNGVFLHKQCYSRVRIISQSVDSAVKLSVLLMITSLAMIISTSAFIVIRLHGQYSTGMLVIDGIGAVGFLFLVDVLLTLCGRCDSMCRNYLRCCKNPELLGEMSRQERKVYLREVESLPKLIVAAGLGQFRLTNITKDNKAILLFYLGEHIVNVLIAF